MSSLARRLVGFLAPSAVAAVVAAVGVGLLEGALNTYEPVQAIGAAGFVAVLAAPAGLVLALVTRGLWRGWQLPELADELRSPSGGAPRLAAWLAYLLFAAWLLVAVTFNASRLLAIRTSTPDVIGLATAIVVVVTAGLLVVVARPGVRLLTALAASIERRVHRRWDVSPWTPPALFLGALVAVAAACYAFWRISMRPRLGHFDVTPIHYALLFLGLVASVHLVWPRLARVRGALVASAIVAVLALGGVLGGAAYLYDRRPSLMLEVWGETRLAGGAIDLLFDVQTRRRDLRLSDVAPTRRSSAPPPDIILITIDTVRADRTPPYGGPAKMPALRKLADAGVVFDWALAPGNVTRRSLPAIITGLAPPRINGRVAGWALRIDPRHVTLAERLRAAGYDTAGFFCCDSFFAPRHKLGFIRGIETLEREYDGGNLARMAREWVRQRFARGDDRPFFLWMHFIEPHNWEQDIAKKGTSQERYDRSLERTDTFLTTILEPLLDDERLQRTLIVVTSDHGEELGDRGHKFHSTNLYNAQIRVPLLVAGLGIEPRRVQRPVSLVEVTPTILELAGFEPPGMPIMDGVSLAPLVRGESADSVDDGYAYAVMMADRSVPDSVAALVVGRYKLIDYGDGKLELYDIIADPDELEDLREAEPAIVERLRTRLDERRRQDMIPPFQVGQRSGR